MSSLVIRESSVPREMDVVAEGDALRTEMAEANGWELKPEVVCREKAHDAWAFEHSLFRKAEDQRSYGKYGCRPSSTRYERGG